MRIVLAGRGGIVRDGLRLVLKSTWPECRLFETRRIEKGNKLLMKQNINLAILEMDVTGNENLEDVVRSVSEHTKVVVLAPYERESIRMEPLKTAGASRVIFRDTSLEEIQAILISIFAIGASI